MPKPRGVFICYRREDAGIAARALYLQLQEAFPDRTIFMDLDSVAPGHDFVAAIQEALASSGTVFVLIGPDWLNRDGAETPRLWQPNDYVRLEVGLALSGKANVVPVFIENAPVPLVTDLPEDLRAIVRRNGLPLRTSDFAHDVSRLVSSVGAKTIRWNWQKTAAVLVAASLLLGLLGYLGSRMGQTQGTPTIDTAAAALSLPPPPAASPAGLPSLAPSATDSAASRAKPYEISDCEVRTANYGDWRAGVQLVTAAAAELATRLCYNYWEFDPRRMAATLKTCATEAHSPTMKFNIVESQGSCELTVRTANLGQRRWVWVHSLYARNAQFGDQIDILEVRGEKLVPYARFWQCGNREQAMKATRPPSDSPASQLSAELRADWPALPADLRGFLCTGDTLGDDLSKP
jgi:hypothetical protein